MRGKQVAPANLGRPESYRPVVRRADEDVGVLGNPPDDMAAFKRKVEAGADSVITQYFYNADAYYRFVDECEAMGINGRKRVLKNFTPHRQSDDVSEIYRQGVGSREE